MGMCELAVDHPYEADNDGTAPQAFSHPAINDDLLRDIPGEAIKAAWTPRQLQQYLTREGLGTAVLLRGKVQYRQMLQWFRNVCMDHPCIKKADSIVLLTDSNPLTDYPHWQFTGPIWYDRMKWRRKERWFLLNARIDGSTGLDDVHFTWGATEILPVIMALMELNAIAADHDAAPGLLWEVSDLRRLGRMADQWDLAEASSAPTGSKKAVGMIQVSDYASETNAGLTVFIRTAPTSVEHVELANLWTSLISSRKEPEEDKWALLESLLRKVLGSLQPGGKHKGHANLVMDEVAAARRSFSNLNYLQHHAPTSGLAYAATWQWLSSLMHETFVFTKTEKHNVRTPVGHPEFPGIAKAAVLHEWAGLPYEQAALQLLEAFGAGNPCSVLKIPGAIFMQRFLKDTILNGHFPPAFVHGWGKEGKTALEDLDQLKEWHTLWEALEHPTRLPPWAIRKAGKYEVQLGFGLRAAIRPDFWQECLPLPIRKDVDSTTVTSWRLRNRAQDRSALTNISVGTFTPRALTRELKKELSTSSSVPRDAPGGLPGTEASYIPPAVERQDGSPQVAPQFVIHCPGLGSRVLAGRSPTEAHITVTCPRYLGKFGPSCCDVDLCSDQGTLTSRAGISRILRHFQYYFADANVLALLRARIDNENTGGVMVKAADGSDQLIRLSAPPPLCPAGNAVRIALLPAHLHEVNLDVKIMLLLLAHRCFSSNEQPSNTYIYGYSAGTYTAAALHRAFAVVSALQNVVFLEKNTVSGATASTVVTPVNRPSTSVHLRIAALNFPAQYLFGILQDTQALVIHASLDSLSRIDMTQLSTAPIQARFLLLTDTTPEFLGKLYHNYSAILRDAPGIRLWTLRNTRRLHVTMQEIGTLHDICSAEDQAPFAMAHLHWYLQERKALRAWFVEFILPAFLQQEPDLPGLWKQRAARIPSEQIELRQAADAIFGAFFLATEAIDNTYVVLQDWLRNVMFPSMVMAVESKKGSDFTEGHLHREIPLSLEAKHRIGLDGIMISVTFGPDTKNWAVFNQQGYAPTKYGFHEGERIVLTFQAKKGTYCMDGLILSVQSKKPPSRKKDGPPIAQLIKDKCRATVSTMQIWLPTIWISVPEMELRTRGTSGPRHDAAFCPSCGKIGLVKTSAAAGLLCHCKTTHWYSFVSGDTAVPTEALPSPTLVEIAATARLRDRHRRLQATKIKLDPQQRSQEAAFLAFRDFINTLNKCSSVQVFHGTPIPPQLFRYYLTLSEQHSNMLLCPSTPAHLDLLESTVSSPNTYVERQNMTDKIGRFLSSWSSWAMALQPKPKPTYGPFEDEDLGSDGVDADFEGEAQASLPSAPAFDLEVALGFFDDDFCDRFQQHPTLLLHLWQDIFDPASSVRAAFLMIFMALIQGQLVTFAKGVPGAGKTYVAARLLRTMVIVLDLNMMVTSGTNAPLAECSSEVAEALENGSLRSRFRWLAAVKASQTYSSNPLLLSDDTRLVDMAKTSWGILITGGLTAADLGRAVFHVYQMLHAKADIIVVDEAQGWGLAVLLCVLVYLAAHGLIILTGDGKQPISASDEQTTRDVIAHLTKHPVGLRTESLCPSLACLTEEIHSRAVRQFDIPPCPTLPRSFYQFEDDNEDRYAWAMIHHLVAQKEVMGKTSQEEFTLAKQLGLDTNQPSGWFAASSVRLHPLLQCLVNLSAYIHNTTRVTELGTRTKGFFSRHQLKLTADGKKSIPFGALRLDDMEPTAPRPVGTPCPTPVLPGVFGLYIPGSLAIAKTPLQRTQVLETIHGILAAVLFAAAPIIDTNNKIAFLSTHNWIVDEMASKYGPKQGAHVTRDISLLQFLSQNRHRIPVTLSDWHYLLQSNPGLLAPFFYTGTSISSAGANYAINIWWCSGLRLEEDPPSIVAATRGYRFNFMFIPADTPLQCFTGRLSYLMRRLRLLSGVLPVPVFNDTATRRNAAVNFLSQLQITGTYFNLFYGKVETDIHTILRCIDAHIPDILGYRHDICISDFPLVLELVIPAPKVVMPAVHTFVLQSLSLSTEKGEHHFKGTYTQHVDQQTGSVITVTVIREGSSNDISPTGGQQVLVQLTAPFIGAPLQATYRATEHISSRTLGTTDIIIRAGPADYEWAFGRSDAATPLLEQGDLNTYPSSSEVALQRFKDFPIKIFEILRQIPRSGAKTSYLITSGPGVTLGTLLQQRLQSAHLSPASQFLPAAPSAIHDGLSVVEEAAASISTLTSVPREAPGGLPGSKGPTSASTVPPNSADVRSDTEEDPDLPEDDKVTSWIEPLLLLHHDSAWGKVKILWDGKLIDAFSRLLIWGDTQATAQVIRYFAVQTGRVIADVLSANNIGGSIPVQWRNITSASKAWQCLHKQEWWTHLILQALRASLDMAISETGDVLPLKNAQSLPLATLPLEDDGSHGGMQHRTLQIGAIVSEIPNSQHNDRPRYRLALPSTVVVSLPSVIIAKLSSTLLDCEALPLLGRSACVSLRTPSFPLGTNPDAVTKTASFFAEFGKQELELFPVFDGLALSQRPNTVRTLRKGLARNPFSAHLFAPIKNPSALQGRLAVEWAPAQGVSGIDALPRFLADMAHFQDEHLEDTFTSLGQTLTPLDPQRYWKQLSDDTFYDSTVQDIGFLPNGLLPKISPQGQHKLLEIVDQIESATEYIGTFQNRIGPLVKQYCTLPQPSQVKAASAASRTLHAAKAWPRETTYAREVRQRTQEGDTTWHAPPWTTAVWEAAHWKDAASAPAPPRQSPPSWEAPGPTWRTPWQQQAPNEEVAINPWPSYGGSTGSWQTPSPSPGSTRSHSDYREGPQPDRSSTTWPGWS